VDVGVPRTIADGQQVTTPGELTWPITNRLATAFVTVSDDQIRYTMALLHRHADLVVEPSGASALAAVLHGAIEVRGRRVGVVLSGANVDPNRFRALIAGVRGPRELM
jgi:threonine dehydratase